MTRRFWAGLVLAGLLLAGCGYHTPGGGGGLAGQGGQTVFVELFDNRTSEPYLDAALASEIVSLLSRSRVVELTAQRETADLTLAGAITAFSSSAQAYNPNDKISQYRARMAITAKLVRRTDNAVLWQEHLTHDETYSAQDDKSLQQAAERLAARVAARRLAEDLMARLLEDF